MKLRQVLLAASVLAAASAQALTVSIDATVQAPCAAADDSLDAACKDGATGLQVVEADPAITASWNGSTLLGSTGTSGGSGSLAGAGALPLSFEAEVQGRGLPRKHGGVPIKLQAEPESGTWAVGMAGLLGIGLMVQRKRHVAVTSAQA